MPDFQVVRNQITAYNGQGFVSASEDAHVKILTTFRTNGTLRKLKGAPLSAFIDVALAEAAETPGVTMQQIEIDTDVSYRHLLRIMPRLCQNGFCAISGTDDEGNQIYRVAAYAWFGKANRAVPSSRGSNTRPPQPPAREPLPSVGGSNTDPTERTPSNSPKQNNRSYDKMSHDKMSHAIGVPNNNKCTDSISNLKEIDKDLLLLNVAMFRKLHVNEPVRSKLARTVEPELVARWAQWIPLAPFHPSGKFYKPVGWMITSLSNDPQCEPPDLADLLEEERKTRERAAANAEYERALAAGEIESDPVALSEIPQDEIAARYWKETMAELQLQMTAATFTTWIKHTRALAFDESAAQLRVAVRDIHSMQWLQHRLYGMIERTVQHVVGKRIKIEFVLPEAPQ